MIWQKKHIYCVIKNKEKGGEMEKRMKMYAGLRGRISVAGGKTADRTLGDWKVLKVLIRGPT